MKDCTVNLTKCSIEPKAWVLRSRSVSVSERSSSAASQKATKGREKYVQIPGPESKRKRRLSSTTVHSEHDNVVLPIPSTSSEKNNATQKNSNECNKTVITPGKRKRRVDSTPLLSRSTVTEEKDNTLSNVIAMNCKLTNEILFAKKQLSEKNDALFKIQQSLHERDIECNNLKAKMLEMVGEIEELKRCMEVMRAERFCDDLIEFGDDAASSKFSFFQIFFMEPI